jgi:hypothetical protein
MKKVRVHEVEDVRWTRIGDRAEDPPPKVFSQLAASELNFRAKCDVSFYAAD